MSFGSLKTLKLERTLGDAVLSITKQVPTEADDAVEFNLLDSSIIQSAENLRNFNPNGVCIKADDKPKMDNKPKEEALPPVIEEKPKRKKGAGRPKGTTKKVEAEKVEPALKPAPKKVATVIETIADQGDKVKLVEKFQASFESEVGFTNEDTYMDEFNSFMTSLISMDYKTFLEAEVTEAQIKTFSDLI